MSDPSLSAVKLGPAAHSGVEVPTSSLLTELQVAIATTTEQQLVVATVIATVAHPTFLKKPPNSDHFFFLQNFCKPGGFDGCWL